MDLGIKAKKGGGVLAEPQSSKSGKSYPRLALHGDHIALIGGLKNKGVGDKITLSEVKLKVTGLSDGEFGKSIDFDVLSAEGFDPAEDSSDDEEKVLGFKRAKKSKPEPKLSAKDLED